MSAAMFFIQFSRTSSATFCFAPVRGLDYGDFKKENTRRPRHTIRPRKKRGVHASGFLSTLLFFCFEIVEIPCQEQEPTHENFSCSSIFTAQKRREVECPYSMRLSTALTGKDKQPTPRKGRYAQTDRISGLHSEPLPVFSHRQT